MLFRNVFNTFFVYDATKEAIKGSNVDSKTLDNSSILFDVQNLLTVEPIKKFDLLTAFD